MYNYVEKVYFYVISALFHSSGVDMFGEFHSFCPRFPFSQNQIPYDSAVCDLSQRVTYLWDVAMHICLQPRAFVEVDMR